MKHFGDITKLSGSPFQDLSVAGKEYDMHEDACYQHPGHVCGHDGDVPGFMREDGKCYCINCHKELEITDKMRKWFEDRAGTKTEMQECFACGGKDCMEVTMRKNNVTLEWHAAYGECRKCGARFIV